MEDQGFRFFCTMFACSFGVDAMLCAVTDSAAIRLPLALATGLFLAIAQRKQRSRVAAPQPPEDAMSDHCVPGTERTFTSFHLWMSVDWLKAAIKHAKSQPSKRCSLVVSIKYPEDAPMFQYKVCDGIGGLETVTGCGDWEPIIRDEFKARTP